MISTEKINSTEFPRAKQHGWDKEVADMKRDIELVKLTQKTRETNTKSNP